MATAKQTIKVRKLKTGGDSGYMVCNMCRGTGRQRKPYSKKKTVSKGKKR